MSTLPVLPLRTEVLFPGTVESIDVGRPGSLKLAADVLRHKPARLLIVPQRDPHVDAPSVTDLYPIGVEAEILKAVKLDSSRMTLVVRVLARRRLGEATQLDPYLMAEALAAEDLNATGTEAEGLALAVRESAKTVIEHSVEIPDEAAVALDAVTSPSLLSDLTAAAIDLGTAEQIVLLQELDVVERLKHLHTALKHRSQVLEVKEKIDTQVREEIGRSQREAILRQKMKAIKEELGESEGSDEDMDALVERLEAAQLPEEADKAARKQLERLRTMQGASPEYSVTRTYLEWLLDLPWNKQSPDTVVIDAARSVLEHDHHGLEKVKRRILEYLAVRKLAPRKHGPILCLYGPPGVGKTSLGRSIARALGREFVRVSLGGVRDEAEIRGHRRTYIGALPGRILQGLKRAGTRNPVFMLDEIDKLGQDFRGDPSSALLEVLDPEQNCSFSDHYLEVPFDLSDVIFIATANDLGPVTPALRDRMEVLELPGYTHDEKREIARTHLVPKQLLEHGLGAQQVDFGSDALDELVEHYTREAGVRQLEREIANVVRAVAVKVASGDLTHVHVGADEVHENLGPTRFEAEVSERTEEPGVATGLAWTPAGGNILFIEATRMPGKGALVLTGQLGDVMKESAQAALSWVRSHAAEIGVEADFMSRSDLHVHVPAGATPKDGPSAGATMLTAMASLLTGRKVRSDVAMTGEVTLRGAVLPVGGIKEKVLAAHRAGLKTVVLPDRNQKDLVDVPDEIRRTLTFVPVKRVDELLATALQ